MENVYVSHYKVTLSLKKLSSNVFGFLKMNKRVIEWSSKLVNKSRVLMYIKELTVQLYI
jgi:hypothetical protein